MKVTIIVAAAMLTGMSLATGPARADAGSRPIYRCEVEGQSVFSDRPCGTDSSAYEADTARVSITKSVPVAATPVREPKPATRRHGTAGASQAARREAACERIDSSLREIRSRMRAGYGVKQGERLKERQRELQAKRKVSHCR